MGAVKAWRQLAGPTDSAKAKDSDPSSLRALYGTDGTKNAVHGSDAFASAYREINFCFNCEKSAPETVDSGEEDVQTHSLNHFASEEKTFALLKPGTSERHSGELRLPAARDFGALVIWGFSIRQGKHRCCSSTLQDMCC